MPRPPKSIHPLRTLRTMTGKTQPEFAALVGVKEITIRRIEGGTLKMSPRLLNQIMIVTGVEPTSLAGDGPLMSIAPGIPYSEKVFERYRAIRATAKPGEDVLVNIDGAFFAKDETARARIKQMETMMEMAALAALQTNQFHVFSYLFGAWMKDAFLSLDLARGVVGISKEMGTAVVVPDGLLNPARRTKPGGGRKPKAG